jgi:adenosine deaminase
MMSFNNSPIQGLLRPFVFVAVGSLSVGIVAPAQTVHPVLTPSEVRASHAFEAAKKLGAPELYAFLKPMPKGADLHMHLSGAVYAETFIAEAVKQGLCIAPVDPGVPRVPEESSAVRFVPSVSGDPEHSAPCAPGQVPASEALKRQPLYDDLIDSFSMRGYVPTPGITGHDQFFSTFDRFSGLKNVAGEWLDEVASRAAAQNEQYLEIMQTPPFTHAATLGYKLGWPAGAEKEVTHDQLAQLRDALLAGGLRDEVAVDMKELADTKAARAEMEHCHSDPSGLSSGESGASGDPRSCFVRIHWLYQVLRGFPPQQVFAQTLLGFEVASADPDVVGVNFVMPEDGRISMQDYHLQMQMLDYLHSVYPRVRLSLHAGEIAPGMVPPEGMRFHVREAVDLGHAERIGHGMDVLYEDRPAELLKEMAEKHVMVEINLTSNDVILGLSHTDHPLAAYRAAHVPVALSTDDEGVSRIDLTHEYVKGAEEQGLTYADLKSMARTSLEHAFLAGESLWAAPDDFTRRKGACAAPITPSSNPTSACAILLKSSERAAAQWELERRFAIFEASIH